MAKSLSHEVLKRALTGGAAAVRARTRLQPAGGPGDKVFPPTFGDSIRVKLPDGSEHTSKYAVEFRRIEGEKVLCVLLDSVASQANRFEEALQRAWDEDVIRFPLVRVDFTGATDEDPALDLDSGNVRSFCKRCGTPLMYERKRSPKWVNLPRALFTGRTGREPRYHLAIEEMQDWIYTGAKLAPLKGYPGVMWERPKKRRAEHLFEPDF
jgi:hypothetical protein